jgi:hypothetical protein
MVLAAVSKITKGPRRKYFTFHKRHKRWELVLPCYFMNPDPLPSLCSFQRKSIPEILKGIQVYLFVLLGVGG